MKRPFLDSAEKLFHMMILGFRWLSKMLFGLILGFVIGVILFILLDNKTGEYLLYLFLLVGLVFGIYFAERVRRRVGLEEYDRRLYGSPDLDDFQDKFKGVSNEKEGNQEEDK